VTFASLINLVKQFDTKRNVAAIMVATLEFAQAAANAHAAKVADALLDAFTGEVSARRSLTAAIAASTSGRGALAFWALLISAALGVHFLLRTAR